MNDGEKFKELVRLVAWTIFAAGVSSGSPGISPTGASMQADQLLSNLEKRFDLEKLFGN